MAATKEVNLDALSVQELTALIKDAETKRSAKMTDAKAALLAEFEKRSAELGMTFAELRASPRKAVTSHKPRKDAGAPVAPKYRGPDGATWSGRGRKPLWLVALEAEGKSAKDYLI